MAHSRGLADYDRCGWGTEWGCKEHIVTADVMLVLNAVKPTTKDYFDNGHRMFHTACAPPGTTTLAQARRRENIHLVKA